MKKHVNSKEDIIISEMIENLSKYLKDKRLDDGSAVLFMYQYEGESEDEGGLFNSVGGGGRLDIAELFAGLIKSDEDLKKSFVIAASEVLELSDIKEIAILKLNNGEDDCQCENCVRRREGKAAFPISGQMGHA